VAVDPSREIAQRDLMRALAASGSYAAALQTYRELRLHLHWELNAEPDPETRALFEEIRAEAQSKAATGGPRRGAVVLGDAATRVSGDGPRKPEPLCPPAAERNEGNEAATVTFLFSDIAGSARLWEGHPDARRLALERHEAILRDAVETNRGHVFKTAGDT